MDKLNITLLFNDGFIHEWIFSSVPSIGTMYIPTGTGKRYIVSNVEWYSDGDVFVYLDFKEP